MLGLCYLFFLGGGGGWFVCVFLFGVFCVWLWGGGGGEGVVLFGFFLLLCSLDNLTSVCYFHSDGHALTNSLAFSQFGDLVMCWVHYISREA